MNSEIHSYPSNISFQGYKSKFSKTLETVLQQGFMDDAQKNYMTHYMDTFVREKVRPNNKIGEGFYNSIYRLDDSYVVKVPKHRMDKPIGEVQILKRLFEGLKTYFGEELIKFGDIRILKNVSSNKKQMPLGLTNQYSRTHTPEECETYYNNVILPTFSSLPQRSFDKIAKDFARLNDMADGKFAYRFDFQNPNNIVLVGKTLRLTDSIERTAAYKMRNTIEDMLDAFIVRKDLTLDNYPDASLFKMREILAKKIITAGMRYNLPLCVSSDTNTIFRIALNNLCGMRGDACELIDALKEISLYSNPNERVKAAEDCFYYYYYCGI